MHNALLDMEELTESDLERLRGRYESLGRNAREELCVEKWTRTSLMCRIRQQRSRSVEKQTKCNPERDPLGCRHGMELATRRRVWYP